MKYAQLHIIKYIYSAKPVHSLFIVTAQSTGYGPRLRKKQ